MPNALDRKQPLLSVVVPVFNERLTIDTVIDRLLTLPIELQIIIVDDGSNDGTQEVIGRLAAAHPTVELVLLKENGGKGRALRAGFLKVQGDFVVIQDADLEYDPAEIPRLIEPLLAGQADVVYGSRFLDASASSTSIAHRACNRLLTFASNAATGLALTDMETCHKAFRAEVLPQMNLRENGFGIEPELTAKLARLNQRFTEIAIGYRGRSYAQGKKVGIADLFRAFYCIVHYSKHD